MGAAAWRATTVPLALSVTGPVLQGLESAWTLGATMNAVMGAVIDAGIGRPLDPFDHLPTSSQKGPGPAHGAVTAAR